MNFLIEHQCPQCGAPAILKETDRLFSCEYCRVKSYLLQKDYFRYMFQSTVEGEKNLIFFPYWRFKGMLFSCVDSGIKHRFMDASHQAVESRYFPVSVGLRSQALKLNFVTPKTAGYFLKPTLSFDNVMEIFANRLNTSLPKPIFHQSHIGETLSLIYSPFYIDGKIYDAILNKPVTPSPSNDFDAMRLPGGRPDKSIQFVPTLCPACGWDLIGQRDSLVLSCKNCNSVWRPSRNELKRMNFASILERENNVFYLPFWRITAEVSGITLNSYADLVKIANLPKAIQKGWDEVKFRFWTLAFKVRPQSFLRLGRNITLSQPQKKLEKELPDARTYPVTLPISEAIESLTINLASFMKPQKDLFPILQDITITPISYLLVYIPFVEKHHEFIQSDFHLTINKNQLALASNL
jgi:ribosomal protein L37AE/L43A